MIATKTNGRGVDVIIDFVGEPYFARNLASLARDSPIKLLIT
ncbi:hypothetical protein [Pseudomonas sp. NyZ201]